MDNIQKIKENLNQAKDLLEIIIQDDQLLTKIDQAANILVDAIKMDNKIISCGNGGSHCDAMHFAEELSGRFKENRPSLPAMAISDPSHISCVGNDYGFDQIFSRFIEGLGKKDDVLVGISTSGNSSNIIRAVEVAQTKGMKVILLTGKDGGELAKFNTCEIRIPHFGYADRIQEIHIKIIHILIELIENKIFQS